MNTQGSDMIERVRWDLRRGDLWEPMLTPGMLEGGDPECVYAPPSWGGVAVAASVRCRGGSRVATFLEMPRLDLILNHSTTDAECALQYTAE